jgi:nitroreductase
MNTKLDFLFSRRSIRKYSDREIPESMLVDLLEAGMAAPSAVAKDPWHFIVLRTRSSIDQLATALPNGKMLAEATAALVVCGDLDRVHDHQLSFLLQDVSAAIENILLAANALGLGTCWLGIHPREERMATVSQLYGLPANIIPVSGISLGWPDEEKDRRTRFNPEHVHWERW